MSYYVFPENQGIFQYYYKPNIMNSNPLIASNHQLKWPRRSDAGRFAVLNGLSLFALISFVFPFPISGLKCAVLL